jgi:hypothetical protein
MNKQTIINIVLFVLLLLLFFSNMRLQRRNDMQDQFIRAQVLLNEKAAESNNTLNGLVEDMVKTIDGMIGLDKKAQEAIEFLAR